MGACPNSLVLTVIVASIRFHSIEALLVLVLFTVRVEDVLKGIVWKLS